MFIFYYKFSIHTQIYMYLDLDTLCMYFGLITVLYVYNITLVEVDRLYFEITKLNFLLLHM